MADLFADALMLALKIFMVSVFLFGLYLLVISVVAAVELAHEKIRTKKEKEVSEDDN